LQKRDPEFGGADDTRPENDRRHYMRNTATLRPDRVELLGKKNPAKWQGFLRRPA
jgi:hypothetical protein